MSLPKISIINFTSNVSDRVVQRVIRSINRQVIEDFMPIWGVGRECILQASAFPPASEEILREDLAIGSAVIYLIDLGTVPNALGYHALNNRGIPFGFVFTDLSEGEDWSVTLSHEVLELIVDPSANIFVAGSSPEETGDTVLHTYEVCDAVERTTYVIDEVEVSNFVTPSYFTEDDEIGTRNDFLGLGVRSFRALRDCHLLFFHFDDGWKTVFGQSGSLIKHREEFMKSGEKKDWPDEKTLRQLVDKYADNSMVSLRRGYRYQANALALSSKRK